MPDLPPVTQEFIADTGRYVAAIEKAILAAQKLAAANAKAVASVVALKKALDSLPDVKRVEVIVRTVEEGGGGALPGVLAGVGAANEAIAAGLKAAQIADAAAAMENLATAVKDEGAAAAAAAPQVGFFTTLLARMRGAAAEGAVPLQWMAAGAAAAGGGAARAAPFIGALATAVGGVRAGAAGAGAVIRQFGAAAAGAAGRAAQFKDAIAGVPQAFMAWVAAARVARGAALAAGGAMGTWWARWGKYVHWAIMAGNEFLAVAIPALIAFASALMVALPGLESVKTHMLALYSATEATYNATHKSIGSFLGLGNALQKAQNAAQPGVYAALGGVLYMLTNRSGQLWQAGLQVIHVFDEFAARVVIDMKTMGPQVHGLLAGMVSDLTGFAQIIGNLGHAILNLASDMPGLAKVLLGIVVAISRVILWISELPRWIVFTVVALEEFVRWGGLLAQALGWLLRIIPALAGILASALLRVLETAGGIIAGIIRLVAFFVRGIGLLIGILGRLLPALAGASTATLEFSASMDAAAANEGLMMIVAAVVIALGALVWWSIQAKTATESWIAASQKTVSAASNMNVLNTIGQQYAQTQMKINIATQQYAAATAHAAQETNFQIGRYGDMNTAAMNAGTSLGELVQYQHQLVSTATTVISNLGYLAHRFHTTAAGAAEMATMVGVNLQIPLTNSSMAAKIAAQNIQNLEHGLGIMGGPAGMVGNDMNYLGIQSALTSTKVQQLNQAFDAWISSVTGGMSALSGLQGQLAQMQQGVSITAGTYQAASGTLNAATSTVKFNLRGVGQVAMQSWGMFTQSVSQAAQVIDNLRIGMAEGVVSTGQFKSVTQALVGEMLKFTGGNAAAVQMLSNLAQAAGGPSTSNLKTLARWAGVAGHAARVQLVKGLQTAAGEMGKLGAAAKNLSVAIGQELNAAMAAAILKYTNVSSALKTYVKDLSIYGSQSQKTQGAQSQLNIDVGHAYALMGPAGKALQGLGGQSQTAGNNMLQAAREAHHLAGMIGLLHSRTIVVHTIFQSTYTSTGAPGGPGGAGPHVRKGAHGGVIGGFAPGMDTVPMMLSPGEAILNPYAVRSLGAGAIHALNQFADSRSAMVTHHVMAPTTVSAGGGGDLVVNVDGRELFRIMAAQGYRYNIRNSGSVTGLLKPT